MESEVADFAKWDRPAVTARVRHLAEVAIVLVMFSWGANVVAVKAAIAVVHEHDNLIVRAV